MTANRIGRPLAVVAGGALLALAPTTALAQEPMYAPDSDAPRIAPRGASVSVGAGAVGFIDEDMRDTADGVGGTWEARAVFGTRSVLGVEAAYIGTAVGMDGPGIDEDAVLLGNGVETALRVNFETRTVLQPYVFGGVGYQRFELSGEGTNTGNIRGHDDLVHLPLGGGLTLRQSGWIADVRAGIRSTFHDDLVDDGEADTRLGTWNLDANVGFEF